MAWSEANQGRSRLPAEQENRMISRLNGLYVRSAECRLREDNVHMRLDSIAEEIRSQIRARAPGLSTELE